MRLTSIAVLLLCGSLIAQVERTTQAVPATVILISLDGFRWDYPRLYSTPYLDQLARRGVQAAALIPSFPTKTYPNHYTIVTGLYPGHHGIVSNNIWDAPTQRMFTLANRSEVQDPMWWGGEPIWVTARRQSQLADPMFWPGSEAPIGGERPAFWQPFIPTMLGKERADRLLARLDVPAGQRPSLLTLYLDDVDTAGHNGGPQSSIAKAAVERVDGDIGRLMEGLERRRLLDSVNVIVVSDHGMSSTSTDRVIILDDFISLDDVTVFDTGPFLTLQPRSGKDAAVYEALSRAHPRLHVYRRNETPARWHYRDHPRIAPIVGVVDDGWQVLLRSAAAAQRARQASPAGRGEHGYDPDVPSMRGIFVAAGPAFKQNAHVDAFQNVDVYNVLCSVLGLRPAPNDGNPSTLSLLLK